MNAAHNLAARIEDRSAVVGVIGLGYVGLPLCDALHGGGLQVLGFDIDQTKIDALDQGQGYLSHLGPDLPLRLLSSERFQATSDFSRLSEADVIFVCVPTPLGPHQDPDLRFVHASARSVGESLRPGQLVVLESTSFPGTTRDEFLPHLLAGAREHGAGDLTLGSDFFVAYSPEREDPGRTTHSTQSTPKLVGGLDAESTRLAASALRVGIEEVIEVSSAEVAEAAKILENTFRSVNIALVNEMKTILTMLDVDVWEVIDAAATKPFGFMPFRPGPGLGGHCIPIDPFYLSWKAREVGRPTRFIELAGEINTSMPDYVIERTVLALSDDGKPARGARVLVLGLAYKAGVDDTRESPSFALIDRLLRLGASVDYSDPFIPKSLPRRNNDIQMTSVELNADSIRSYDVLLVATDHKEFDYELIARNANLIVDTRNAMRPSADLITGRWVKA